METETEEEEAEKSQEKKQLREAGGGEEVKPGKGAPKKEHSSANTRDRGKGKEEMDGVAKRQKRGEGGVAKRQGKGAPQKERTGPFMSGSSDERVPSEVSSAPGPAGDMRPAAAEPVEGGGGATKQQGDGGEGKAVVKIGKGAHKKKNASPKQRDGGKGKEEGGVASKTQRSKCPHQRQKSRCKECGGAGICPHQRIRSQCKECGVGGKRPTPVVGTEEGGGAAKKQRRVKLQATLPPNVSSHV